MSDKSGPRGPIDMTPEEVVDFNLSFSIELKGELTISLFEPLPTVRELLARFGITEEASGLSPTVLDSECWISGMSTDYPESEFIKVVKYDEID
jgi:hypothetical protein